jgi:hypothetical protein
MLAAKWASVPRCSTSPLRLFPRWRCCCCPLLLARLAAGDHAGLEKNIARMTWMILAASIALTVGFELLSEPLLRIYLGPSGAAYLPMARIIYIGALPFAFFNGMRSVLDAYFHTPRNGVNLMVAFGLLLLGRKLSTLLLPRRGTPWAWCW